MRKLNGMECLFVMQNGVLWWTRRGYWKVNCLFILNKAIGLAMMSCLSDGCSSSDN